jgi:PPOX class probable F420-dependent enzyme
MDAVDRRGRFDAARVARLATVRPDGGPHVVPCCFARVGPTVFSAVDAKPKSTFALQRLANIAARPEASLLVDHYEDDWARLWWVRVDGEARVLDASERDAALAALAAKYAQYAANPPPGPVIAVAIRTWRAWP